MADMDSLEFRLNAFRRTHFREHLRNALGQYAGLLGISNGGTARTRVLGKYRSLVLLLLVRVVHFGLSIQSRPALIPATAPFPFSRRGKPVASTNPAESPSSCTCSLVAQANLRHRPARYWRWYRLVPAYAHLGSRRLADWRNIGRFITTALFTGFNIILVHKNLAEWRLSG